MIKHIWSILCEKSITDSQTNNISLINSLERLQVTIKITSQTKKAVMIPTNYVIVSFFTREKRDRSHMTIRTSVTDHTDKELGKHTQKIEFKDNSTRLRNHVRMGGLPVTTSGLYKFLVRIRPERTKKFKTVAEIPLEVELHKEPERSRPRQR